MDVPEVGNEETDQEATKERIWVALKQKGSLRVVADRGLERGDVAIIDFEARRSDNGEVIAGSERKGMQVDTMDDLAVFGIDGEYWRMQTPMIIQEWTCDPAGDCTKVLAMFFDSGFSWSKLKFLTLHAQDYSIQLPCQVVQTGTTGCCPREIWLATTAFMLCVSQRLKACLFNNSWTESCLVLYRYSGGIDRQASRRQATKCLQSHRSMVGRS